jgi:hypothetical protein
MFSFHLLPQFNTLSSIPQAISRFLALPSHSNRFTTTLIFNVLQKNNKKWELVAKDENRRPKKEQKGLIFAEKRRPEIL